MTEIKRSDTEETNHSKCEVVTTYVLAENRIMITTYHRSKGSEATKNILISPELLTSLENQRVHHTGG